MKKKLISILLTSVMTVGLLSACGSAHTDDNTKNSKTNTTETVSDISRTDSGSAPVSVTLNEVAHSIFYAPMYAAIENGYFDEEGKRDKGKIKQALVNIVKNPIIDSIFLGLIVSLLGIHFPTIVNKTINSVAQLATPLALIVIGAGFEGRKAIAKIKPTCWAAAIKLVIQPLVFLPVAAYMGFSGEKIIAILIMLASPTTPSCYIMAKSMKNDGVLTASVIVATTLFAAFTLTFWIFLLRTFGLI